MLDNGKKNQCGRLHEKMLLAFHILFMTIYFLSADCCRFLDFPLDLRLFFSLFSSCLDRRQYSHCHSYSLIIVSGTILLSIVPLSFCTSFLLICSHH